MAGSNFVFNIARGKLGYYYYAVKNSLVVTAAGTPAFTSTANAIFVVVLIEATGLEADATLADYDDMAALIAGTSNEQTNQARKTLSDVELAAVPAPDDANNRLDLDIPDLVYTALGGNAIAKLLVGFDPDSTGGTDSSIIPLTAHSFDVTPDGTDVTAQVAATGFYRSA
jgi:hypothetical protein